MIETIYELIISLFNAIPNNLQIRVITELRRIVFLKMLNNHNIHVLENKNKNYICISYIDRNYKILLYVDILDKSIKIIINNKDDAYKKSFFKNTKKTIFSPGYSFEYICNQCLNYNSDSDIDVYFDYSSDIDTGCRCESSKELIIKMEKWDENFVSLFNNYNTDNIECLEKFKIILQDLHGHFYDLKNIKLYTTL